MFQQHIFISILIISIFPFILYWLSIIYSVFFSKTGKNIVSREFYECGFKVINDNYSVIDIQFSVIGLIFLVYEMEIILFVPLFLNYSSFSFLIIIFLIFSLFIILFSYVYEWERYSLMLNF
jgi:NADH:ubiquinone oxidoreductase subunit 3 (subunit A)